MLYANSSTGQSDEIEGCESDLQIPSSSEGSQQVLHVGLQESSSSYSDGSGLSLDLIESAFSHTPSV